MKRLFKRSRFFIGIVLIIHTFMLFVLCISQIGKRKSLAGAFAALAAFCAGVGSLFVVRGAKDEEDRLDMIDSLCGSYIYVNTNEQSLKKSRKGDDIPVSESVDE